MMSSRVKSVSRIKIICAGFLVLACISFVHAFKKSLDERLNEKSYGIRDSLKEVNTADIRYLKEIESILDVEEIKVGLQLTDQANTFRIALNNISVFLSVYMQLEDDQVSIKKICNNTINTNKGYITDQRKTLKMLLRYPLSDRTMDFGSELIRIIDDTERKLLELLELMEKDMR
ncbi:hypothetical protein ACFLTD_02125 [Elusimicrobiota bacterium]